MRHRLALACLVASWLSAPSVVHADDSGRRLASPWADARPDAGDQPPSSASPEARSESDAAPHNPVLVEHVDHGDAPAPESGHPSGVMLDVYATTLVPLAVGGAMHLEFWEGLFVRVSGSVVVPAYVDAVNDVGLGYGLWDDSTASSISELLVDSIILEGALGIRPLNGPLELSVGYFMFWSEGPGPRALDMQERVVTVSIYAVHAELAIRIPLGDALMMRIGIGWIHSVGHDVSVSATPGESETEALSRTFAQSMLSNGISQYGMGPSLSAGLGIHFE